MDASQKKLDELIDAAFESYIDDYEMRFPIIKDPLIPASVRASMRQTVKEVFSAGFSSAYAAYIVDRLVGDKGQANPK